MYFGCENLFENDGGITSAYLFLVHFKSGFQLIIVPSESSFDDAMKRFKRQVNKAGTIADYRKHDFFLKKGLKRKLKSENARRKH